MLFVAFAVLAAVLLLEYWTKKGSVRGGFFLAREVSPAQIVPPMLADARRLVRIVQYKISAKGARKALRAVMRKQETLVMELLLDRDTAHKKARLRPLRLLLLLLLLDALTVG